MKKHPRLKKANIIFLLIFVVIIAIGFIDSIQINALYETNQENKYEIYGKYVAPSFIALWYIIFICIAIVWFMFTFDWSESIGVFLAGWVMLWFTTPDIFFFMLSKVSMTAEMCWFNTYQSPLVWISKLLGETCVSPTALIISSILGIIVSYVVFMLLLWHKPRKTKGKKRRKKK